MIAYLDASVLLRKLLGEPNPLARAGEIEAGYSSRIVEVEVGRVIDRYRLAGTIDDAEVADLQQEARRALRLVAMLSLSAAVLRRATAAMPVSLGTLDAIHLATALELAPRLDQPLALATHDVQLARAARASGLDVYGV